MPEVPPDIRRELATLGTALDKQAREHKRLEPYDEGKCPLPKAIVQAKLTKAYRMLMPMAEAPWGSLVVDSTLDRLELTGIDTGDKEMDKILWDYWQDNEMDAESKIGIRATLVDGRSFATVWRPPGSDSPEISLDDSATMVIRYRSGSRRDRVSALRRWVEDDDRPYATLYTRTAIWKFRGPKNASGQAGTQWDPYQPSGDEEWPVENPYEVVPVVELPINRRLRPGSFPYARGEYAHCTPLIDRINLLTFLGLVVAFYQGFPLRGVIGEKIKYRILKDDEGNTLFEADGETPREVAEQPFDATAGGLFQLEDAAAKIAEYKQADRKNLAIYPELDQFSTVTKTPRHYFPMENGMTNLAADAIRASEGSLHAKVTNYKPTLGNGLVGINQLVGLMSDEELVVPSRSSMTWADHESRSMAERADAATKLASLKLPWQVIAARYLNFTPQDIAKAEAMMASQAFTNLLDLANAGAEEPADEDAAVAA